LAHLRSAACVLILVVLLVACRQSSTTSPASSSPVSPATAAVSSMAPVATQAPDASAQASTLAPGLPPLPPDPQRIEFNAEDGIALVGYYYPAAYNPAPLVVLMHWAGGDQTDWKYVGMVSWLQNRGLPIPAAPTGGYFDTPYPFKPLPESISYGVFTFDFRGYGESDPTSGSQSDLIQDARAAYTIAASLEGVQPGRVVGIGASIGADGVVDGCSQGCLGALSLGPGGYLDTLYAAAVKTLDDQEKTTWCVAAEDDQPGAQACQDASGNYFHSQVYPSGGHTMRLFRVENNLQPPIEAVIQDFLRVVYHMPVR
jgi:pimeloyl-ACP methyl ester carboxylesterase